MMTWFLLSLYGGYEDESERMDYNGFSWNLNWLSTNPTPKQHQSNAKTEHKMSDWESVTSSAAGQSLGLSPWVKKKASFLGSPTLGPLSFCNEDSLDNQFCLGQEEMATDFA